MRPFVLSHVARLWRVSGRGAIRALEKPGFEQVRQRGSHVVLTKQSPGGLHWMRGTSASRTGDWYLRGILKQDGLGPDEFMEVIWHPT
jgi:predicted RNA binding protein YcfA (HicA-like mRNA interferase family)